MPFSIPPKHIKNHGIQENINKAQTKYKQRLPISAYTPQLDQYNAVRHTDCFRHLCQEKQYYPRNHLYNHPCFPAHYADICYDK